MGKNSLEDGSSYIASSARGRPGQLGEDLAVTDILNNFSLFGFNGKVFTEGRSFAQLGASQLDPAITIFDDPTGPCSRSTRRSVP